jgi:uncharacterized protein
MAEYRNRIVDDILKFKLEVMGAVLIQGAKATGKTTTAKQAAKSVVEIDKIKDQADMDPESVLVGETPRLLDEWQTVPKLFDYVRREVDRRDGDGQFILTGSAVPADSSKIVHSGVGRYAFLKMRPMSLFESGESSGEVSLEKLFNSSDHVGGTNRLRSDNLAFLIARGGWPKTLGKSDRAALDVVEEYVAGLVNSDLSRADGIRKDPDRVRRIMRSIARNQGGKISNKVIRDDIVVNDLDTIDEDTIALYVNSLKSVFAVEDMPAWNINIRSKTAVRSLDTRYFVDPSIAVASLGIGPEELTNDAKTFGLLFETMCIRDLRIYTEALGGSVNYYRDRYGLECDAVLHLRNGKYALVEIKLGGDVRIEEGAKNLNKLESLITGKGMRAPSFKMILTGTTEYAYRRNDGISIVPVGCLKP